MIYSSISAIGTFTALTSATADYLFLDPGACTGGVDATLRTTVEDAPGADGALVFPPLDGARYLTLSGPFIITSSGTESGYPAARETLLATLKTALNALKASPGNLVHSGGTLSVYKNAPLDTSYQGALLTVTFGLVVAT